MSLFIGTLAYEDAAALDQIQLAVLVASLLSGTTGALVSSGRAQVRRHAKKRHCT